MMLYRKRPVVIEAEIFDGKSLDQILWIESNGGKTRIDPADGALYIVTLEGDMRVSVGDYIIRGVQNEFYPCKPDIFLATYEKV